MSEPAGSALTTKWTKAQESAAERLGMRAEADVAYAVGPHTLVVGSTAQRRVRRALYAAAGRSFDVCWTDPPWDDRIGRQFARQAGVDVDSPGGGAYDELAEVFAGLGEVLQGVAHIASIWTGWPAASLARETLAGADFTVQREVEVTYEGTKSTSPVQVGVREFDGRALETDLLGRAARGMAGTKRGREQIEGFVAAAYARLGRPMRMVEPFCGQEVAASVCGDERVESLSGIELHPGRATRTLLAMSRACAGAQPQVVGSVADLNR